MRVISSIEKLSEEIGYDIGNSDDLTQAKLLNGFSKALINNLGSDMDTQICAFVDKIEPRNHKVFKAINDFINLKEQ